MTIQQELDILRSRFNQEDISVTEALELQWQIDFLEGCYSAELEDFDYA